MPQFELTKEEVEKLAQKEQLIYYARIEAVASRVQDIFNINNGSITFHFSNGIFMQAVQNNIAYKRGA